MKEPIAVNRYTMTKALFYEGMLRTWKERTGKTTKTLLFVLAGLWIVLAVLTLILRESPAFLVVEFFVLGLIALWVEVLLPRQKAGKAFKRFQARYFDNLERTTECFEDDVVIHAGDNEIEVDYGEITEILQTEHLLILVSSDKTGVMLTHNGFDVGDEKTLLAHIRAAHPQECMKRYIDNLHR